MGPLADPEPKGTLWLVDPTTVEPSVQPLALVDFPADADFHPLGLEAVELDGKTNRLFVVNHQRKESTIEVFELSREGATTAKHVATLSHPSFTGAPNSIAAISPTSFYLTHDHKHTRRVGTFLGTVRNMAETLLSLPLSRVDLVTFSLDTIPQISVETVATGIAFANGASLSPSGRTLAVASTTRRQVHFYSRDTITNALTLEEKVDVPFLVDNINYAPQSFASPTSPYDDVDEDPPLIAAGHPHYFSLLSVARNKTLLPTSTHPSSWVVAISPRRPGASANLDDPAWTRMPARKSSAEPSYEVNTLFASRGGAQWDEAAFGMSTTGVAGGGAGGEGRWLVVVGLYETGVRVVKE